MVYSIQNRLILTFVILIIIPFLCAIIILWAQAQKTLRDSIENNVSQTIHQNATLISTLTHQFSGLAKQTLSNQITQEWINAQQDPGVSQYQKFLIETKFKDYLYSQLKFNPTISSIVLYSTHGDSIGVPAVKSWAYPSNHPWLALGDSITLSWQGSHKDEFTGESSVNSVIIKAVNISTLEPYGIIKINYPTELLQRPLDEIKLGKTGRLFLTDGEGTLILKQDRSVASPELTSTIRHVTTISPHSGMLVSSSHNRVTFYSKLPLNDWILVGELPNRELYEQLDRTFYWIMGSASLLLFLIAAAVIWFTNDLVRPLSNMTKAMRLVERGQFKTASLLAPSRFTSSQIGYVVKVFYNMLASIQRMIETQFELTIRRKDAEYKALLLQINPHFLYNTLEVISGLAADKKYREIMTASAQLGRLLRYSLKLDQFVVKLKEEFNHIGSYIAIQQVRFRDRLHVSIQVDPEAEEFSIIKFILQPLVENALKYTLDYKDISEIAIRARVQEDGLRIEVSDNGIGISEEGVRRIQDEKEFITILNTSGMQIGLRNVLARCKSHYEEDFEFKIHSVPGEGTSIILHIKQNRGSH